jgi:hypothetical protein
MTKEWVLTVTLTSKTPMSSPDLQKIRNTLIGRLCRSVTVELDSSPTPAGTRITIIGDEEKVSSKALPYLCDQCSTWGEGDVITGAEGRGVKRVLKDRRSEGVCSHLVPGEDAVIGRSTTFKVAHFKIAEVPKATSVHGRQADGEMEEAMRWLIDQFMKMALSPAFYGHPTTPDAF